MTALGQGTAGLALVMSFALLCIQQIRAAAILLLVQCAAVCASALVYRQYAMALAPWLLAAGVWIALDQAQDLETRTLPVGGAKLSVGVGAVLAVLCQSQPALTLALAVLLLAVLLIATRRHPLMHVVGLATLQNGAVLAVCLTATGPSRTISLLPLAMGALPFPLAVSLMVPPPRGNRAAAWYGWGDLAIAVAVLGAAIGLRLEPMGTVFAPLIAFDGMIRAWLRVRRGLPLVGRGLAVCANLFAVAAVWLPNPILAWVAIVAAIAAGRFPILARRWDEAVLAFTGAGLLLFGLLLTSVAGSLSLLVGAVMIAAALPDLAVVILVLLLRLSVLTPWAPMTTAPTIAVAIGVLLGCAVLLQQRSAVAQGKRPSAVALLTTGQFGIALLCIGLGTPDGRFAAFVLAALLVLTRSAARFTDEPAGTIAVAGLGGVPPLGVFPGVVLAVLAISHRAPWLLLPTGVAAVAMLLSSLPRSLPARIVTPSLGWLPLALALLAGYFTPNTLVRWCQLLTAGAR